MIYIGVDVGKNGGYAVIYPNNTVVEAWSDEGFMEEMRNVALSDELCVACVEQVGAMPNQGVKSMFSFGKSAGFIEGVLRANLISFQLVKPREWKKEFGLNSDKAKSIEVCQRLFPKINLLATPRCKVPHDGMAEALLMAEYAKRKL
ncbi:MAG: hypothetical protein IKY40_00620 [Phascolarctobacterium sp.]|nr:hypothetical protein [Phascolarctobacterium sp.]MBR5790232.1 hypothetical protein [Phascolarctobacterium sp.]